MLEVTTTPPVSAAGFFREAAPHQPPTPKNLEVLNPKENQFISVYLHGELQGEAGYDIAVFHSGKLRLPTSSEPRLTEVCRTWIAATRQWRETTMRIWLAQDQSRVLGLITSNTDTQSNQYAKTRMNARADGL